MLYGGIIESQPVPVLRRKSAKRKTFVTQYFLRPEALDDVCQDPTPNATLMKEVAQSQAANKAYKQRRLA